MTTLKEVAEHAGVSIRTVTRALKNEPGGNLKTYARVKAIADELGYVPNIAARNLKMRRSNIVGLVASSHQTSVMMRKQAALQRCLEQSGKYLLSGTGAEDGEALVKMLREWIGLVRDVVFLQWRLKASPSDVLAGLPIRFVFVDCVDEEGVHSVLTDRGVGVREGVEALLAAGRRRIAQCGRNMPTRRRGFDAAFTTVADAGIEKHELRTVGLEFEDGYQAGRSVLEHKLDAVFFETDRLALGFYKFAFDYGVRIPDDVAVIGFDDDPAGRYACPPLSTVAHPIEQVCEEVCARLREPGAAPRNVWIPTRFVRRGSV